MENNTKTYKITCERYETTIIKFDINEVTKREPIIMTGKLHDYIIIELTDKQLIELMKLRPILEFHVI